MDKFGQKHSDIGEIETIASGHTVLWESGRMIAEQKVGGQI